MLVEGPRPSGKVAPKGPFSMISTISGDAKDAGEGGDWGRARMLAAMVENLRLCLLDLLRLELKTESIGKGSHGGEEDIERGRKEEEKERTARGCRQRRVRRRQARERDESRKGERGIFKVMAISDNLAPSSCDHHRRRSRPCLSEAVRHRACFSLRLTSAARRARRESCFGLGRSPLLDAPQGVDRRETGQDASCSRTLRHHPARVPPTEPPSLYCHPCALLVLPLPTLLRRALPRPAATVALTGHRSQRS